MRITRPYPSIKKTWKGLVTCTKCKCTQTWKEKETHYVTNWCGEPTQEVSFVRCKTPSCDEDIFID